ncbi:MAG: molybdopterin-synthase adenylyltransferase MoeB [Halobacteriaceae archaeon]
MAEDADAGLALDGTQLERYSRHIIMDDVGPEGQARLLDSSVLVVGAGGLGAPVLQYLAAAGVGRIGVVDDDVVERSNLQRQVIHADADVGEKKVESARAWVAAHNPDVTVEARDLRLTADNVEDVVAGYDLVVDGADNFPTRYLVNDACTLAGVPHVYGAVHRFEGQVAAFTAGQPCYRCLFPEAPPEGTVPDCATAGVLGVLPGTVGCLQATEALKLLLGEGDALDGRLLVYDAAGAGFDEVELAADPDCPVCGTDPEVTDVAQATYEGTCSL